MKVRIQYNLHASKCHKEVYQCTSRVQSGPMEWDDPLPGVDLGTYVT